MLEPLYDGIFSLPLLSYIPLVSYIKGIVLLLICMHGSR